MAALPWKWVNRRKSSHANTLETYGARESTGDIASVTRSVRFRSFAVRQYFFSNVFLQFSGETIFLSNVSPQFSYEYLSRRAV